MDESNTVFAGIDKTVLLQGIAAADRLIAMANSAVGEDVRQILVEIANKWLDKVKKGDPHAHAALNAIDEVANQFEYVIRIGDMLRTELVRRQGGRDGDSDTARARAEA